MSSKSVSLSLTCSVLNILNFFFLFIKIPTPCLCRILLRPRRQLRNLTPNSLLLLASTFHTKESRTICTVRSQSETLRIRRCCRFTTKFSSSALAFVPSVFSSSLLLLVLWQNVSKKPKCVFLKTTTFTHHFCTKHHRWKRLLFSSFDWCPAAHVDGSAKLEMTETVRDTWMSWQQRATSLPSWKRHPSDGSPNFLRLRRFLGPDSWVTWWRINVALRTSCSPSHAKSAAHVDNFLVFAFTSEMKRENRKKARGREERWNEERERDEKGGYEKRTNMMSWEEIETNEESHRW